MQQILGIDIGGTKIALVLAKADRDQISLIDKVVFPTQAAKGYSQTIERLYQQLDHFIEKHEIDMQKILAGISCGGPLDSKNGVILSPPNLIGWDEIEIVKILNEKYHCDAFLQNDANACALAEWQWGAGRQLEHVIFLTYGTGMGAGLILNGRLFEGGNGMAGEIGHMRMSQTGPVGYGKIGSFEGFTSGSGIVQLAEAFILQELQKGVRLDRYESDYKNRQLTTKKIFEYARQGDRLAEEIVACHAGYLGHGLAVLIDLLNPQRIILGTIYIHDADLLADKIKDVIAKEALARSAGICDIVPAGLGVNVGDYGAAAAAYYHSNQ